MTMNLRALRTHSLLYIALITVTFLTNACGDAADLDDLTGFDAWEKDNPDRGYANTPSAKDSPRRPFVPGAALPDPTNSGTQDTPPPTSDNTPPANDSPDSDAPADNPAPSDPAATDTPTTSSADSTAFLSKSDTRALWVWNENPSAQQLIESGGAQDELFAFLAAPHNQPNRAINRLFFEARGYSNADRFETVRTPSFDPIKNAADQQHLRSFLARAHAQGVAVEYLDGQAIWVASDANAQAPKDICTDVLAFNRTSTNVAERFDGIHLDIEPHTVQSGSYAGVWWENRLPGGYNAEWTARWKDILNTCRQKIDAYTAETGHRVTLSSDLGTDYAHYNAPILAFLNRSDGPLDYLTIMNYFDNRANSDGNPSYFHGDDAEGTLVGGVIQNLNAWSNLPLLFAMETGPESIASDAQSFFQEGYGALYHTVDSLLTNHASPRNLGVGFHHYSPQSYRDLTP